MHPVLENIRRTPPHIYAGGMLFILLLAIYCDFWVGSPIRHRVGSDGFYYYHYMVSLYHDHDVDFSNDYGLHADPYRLRDKRIPATGRPANTFYIGPALLWLPVYATARMYSSLCDKDSMDPGEDYAWHPAMQAVVMGSALVYATILFMLMVYWLRGYFDCAASLTAGGTLILGTGLLWYIVFNPSMSHLYDVLTLMVAIVLFVQWRRNYTSPWLCLTGLALGFHITIRAQNAVTALIFSILIAYTLWRTKKVGKGRFCVSTGLLGVSIIVGALPLLVSNLLIYKELWPLPYTYVDPHPDIFLVWTRPKIIDVWFSWRNGLFSTHPVLLLGVLGLAVYAIKSDHRDPLIIALAAIFFAHSYINSCIIDWWAGHSFGQRRLINTFPFFAFGMAALFHYSARRFVGISILVTSFFMNYYLILMYRYMWNPKEAHHIWQWMFVNAPKWIVENWLR